jgi:hypothetical protein
MIQLSEAPRTPSQSSRSQRLRSASPQNFKNMPSPTLLRKSKSSEVEGTCFGTHSTRSNRSTRLSRSSSSGSSAVNVPKRSSSIGGITGFFNLDKSEHRNQSAHLRTPSNSSRRTRHDENSAHSSQRIICLGKSYRNNLSLDDSFDDDICSHDRSRRNSSRRTRTYSPGGHPVTPRRSESLGSGNNANNSFKKAGEGCTKKFQSLLQSKKEEQSQSHAFPNVASNKHEDERIKHLGRSYSGDVQSMGQFMSPARSSSWDGPGWGAQPRLERRNGLIPCTASPSSSHHRRPKLPCLDNETDETVSMDSNSFRSSQPSSASSKEEIFNNAVRRAKERQLQKQQRRHFEQQQQQQRQQHSYYDKQRTHDRTSGNECADDMKSHIKSRRSTFFGSIRDSTGTLFPKHPSQHQHHSQQTQVSKTFSSYSKDDDDNDDESIVSQDSEDAPKVRSGPSLFERGLKALEQIYDDLNV